MLALGAVFNGTVARGLAAWIAAKLTSSFMKRIGLMGAGVLAFFGLQFVATEWVMEPLMDRIAAEVGGVGGVGVQWIAFFNLDRYITIIGSAMAAGQAKSWAIKRVAST